MVLSSVVPRAVAAVEAVEKSWQVFGTYRDAVVHGGERHFTVLCFADLDPDRRPALGIASGIGDQVG